MLQGCIWQEGFKRTFATPVKAVQNQRLLKASKWLLCERHAIHGTSIYSSASGLASVSKRLCCTKRVRDSCRESSVVAGQHEQTDTSDLQDHELGCLQ